MIQVKENLYAGDDIFIEAENKPYNNKGINLPDYFIDGEIYTFSAKVKQSNNGSGRCGFVFKFKYDKERQAEILIYSDVQEKTHNIGAEFYNISIVKGDGVDIYVPNKNSLEPSNQAIFPIGGGITKSCLYRGVEQSSFRKEVAA